jgi:hypothetical protein
MKKTYDKPVFIRRSLLSQIVSVQGGGPVGSIPVAINC